MNVSNSSTRNHRKFFSIVSIFLAVVTLVVVFIVYPSHAGSETYIRVNQVGFLPSDPKSAIIMSVEPLTKTSFKILDENNNPVFEGELGKDLGPYLSFGHHYLADFSMFQQNGKYTISYSVETSPPFRIGKQIYSDVIKKVLGFYDYQECGNIKKENRNPCHLADPTVVIGSPTSSTKPDLTGGWHDAGDYTKFTNTTAYSSYFLLLSYQQHKMLASAGAPNLAKEILVETKVGLDWLLKAHYKTDRLIVQVSDGRDHDVGWRLPENDKLAANNRPAYDKPSRSLCGIYAASLALAAKVYAEEGNSNFATACLTHAKEVYNLGNSTIPTYSAVADSMYLDKSAEDNMALAGIELYRATGEPTYLIQANKWAETADVVQWFSWGDLEGLALVRLGTFQPTVLPKVAEVLRHFNEISNANPYGYPLESFPWASLGQQTAIATIGILYQQASGSTEFASLIANQRDFVLGRNSHGVSFIGNVGTEYTKNFHHQIAHLKMHSLPGGVAEGYTAKALIQQSGIVLSGIDRFARFQTPEVVYYDDRNDFIGNEPTIVMNAQTLFMLSWFVQK